MEIRGKVIIYICIIYMASCKQVTIAGGVRVGVEEENIRRES